MTKPQVPELRDPHTIDLFTGEADALRPNQKTLTPTTRRMIESSTAIIQDPPDKIDFLHAVLCQVGMPRKRTEARIFERRSGSTSMLLEAGRLWHRGEWQEQPLPYGTKPRLVMIHISSEAIRTQNRQIEVGGSVREFLLRLGIDTSGGKKGGYTGFKQQMEALAACRLTLGMSLDNRDVTINTQPISRFDAWFNQDGKQQSFWSGSMELSQQFYETLISHAVPLDSRALAALKHSSLALDIYTWLAHRLYRITKSEGVKLTWTNLRDQFGQEYTDPKNFKHDFLAALTQVKSQYPDARIEKTDGGIILKCSPPPIRKTQIQVLKNLRGIATP